jgi:hypothetical protein
MWLGFAGILAAGFAIVSSFGLCAAIGVEFVSIVGVVPFLVIGKIQNVPPCSLHLNFFVLLTDL